MADSGHKNTVEDEIDKQKRILSKMQKENEAFNSLDTYQQKLKELENRWFASKTFSSSDVKALFSMW